MVLTEEYRWIGGQLTVQATPPDEHPWIEELGASASYRGFRDAVRRYYREHFALSSRAQADRTLNPGNATVSKLAIEPFVSEAVLRASSIRGSRRARSRCSTRTRPVAAEADGDRIGAVEFADAAGDRFTVSARYVIDATETAVSCSSWVGSSTVTGAEAQSDTGEPHAPAVAAPPEHAVLLVALRGQLPRRRRRPHDRPPRSLRRVPSVPPAVLARPTT